MELFKFIASGAPTTLLYGQLINNLKSVMWTERYREPGEFEITALLSTGIRDFLPIGTFISHIDTYEVMIVENHEVSEEPDEDPVIKITGRTLDSFLEQRIAGTNNVRTSSLVTEYAIAANWAWIQAVTLINDHIKDTSAGEDALIGIVGATNVTGSGTESVIRIFDRGPVLPKLLELLAVEDLGIRTIRRNDFLGTPYNTQTTLMVYKGVDRSASVIFSWKSGDLEAVDYLFSNKRLKTSCMVVGRYVSAIADIFGLNYYDRRMMVIDGTDIDGNLSAPPAGAALSDIYLKMQNRGKLALKSQGNVTLNRSDISDAAKYQYRKDYYVGDLVTLDANYNQIVVVRVVEYVEIEDERGESGASHIVVTRSISMADERYLDDKSYNAVKNLNLYILPILGSLYFAVGIIFDLSLMRWVLGGLVVFMAFLGIVAKMSSNRYVKKHYGGQIVITQVESGRKIFSLELNKDPEELEELDTVQFKVTKQDIDQDDDL